MNACESPRIAVVVKRFPKLSETFVLGEIRALLDAGLAIRVISLLRPDETLQQPGADELREQVSYLDEAGIGDALVLWSRSLLRAPLVTMRTAARALRERQSLVRIAALCHLCDLADARHVHVHYLSEPSSLVLLASALRGSTFSISAHAKDIYLSDPNTIRKKIARAAFVATCTRHNAEYLGELAGIEGSKIHAIYHGVDATRFRPDAPTRPRTGPVRVLAVGRFREKKGFDVLIDACARLLDGNLTLSCDILGYGERREDLQRRIDALGIGAHVRLREPVTHARMVDELRRADLFVLPCRQCADGDRDGIPNALLEAMACALPVISTTVSGIPEVVAHGVNGMLVAPDDPEALARAIGDLVADAPLRQTLSAGARRTVLERFDWQRNVHALAALLRDVVLPADAMPAPGAHPTAGAMAATDTITGHRSALDAGAVVEQAPRIAYVLKGFPRLSESFIANEIRQLRRRGLALGLFSIKTGDALAAADDLPPVHYAPTLESMSGIGLLRWFARNHAPFLPDQRYWLRAAPRRYLATLAFAVGLAVRHRAQARGIAKKTHIKEFLLATHFAHRIAEDGRYDHIHAHFCHDATTIAWMTARLCALPFSFTAHAKDIYQRNLNPRDLLARKLDAAAFAITCTQLNVETLRALTDDPSKVHGIYHGLDTRQFRPRDVREASSDATRVDRPLLLSVGRHVEKKGFEHLIDACAILRDRDVRFRLEIIGESAERTPFLRQRIDAQDLDEDVTLSPPLPQASLVQRYEVARLFVLPCVVLADGDRDGIPNVMAEAMACALPVVVTGVSGIPELVDDGSNGLIVPERDAVALADAIERVLRDDDLAARLGLAARRRIEVCFDADDTHGDLQRLFDSRHSPDRARAA